VFTPFHWGGAASANALTDPALDPHSKMPAFKVCAVAIGVPAAPATKGADMRSSPRFLQGVYIFEGKGIDRPFLLDAALTYTVPDGVTAQAVYFRGGNTTAELVCAVLMRDGAPLRYFPIGAKADVHVPLRVVEDPESGTVVELHLGITGAVGAFGGVLVNLAFRQSFLTYKTGDIAYLAFIACYAACTAITWAVYLRPSPRRPADA
jgi:assimilatory nitrate reductase catalytic subunit